MASVYQLYFLLGLGERAIEEVLNNAATVLQKGIVAVRSGVRVQKDQTLESEGDDQIVVQVHLCLQGALQRRVITF